MAWFGTLGKLNHPSDLAREGSQMPLAVASRKSADILSGGLDRERRCPQRIDVHAQRVPFQHLVVEVARRPGRVGELIEVANVLPRLLEDSRTVFIPGPLVSCNYRARLQRFDFVERSDPFASCGLDSESNW
jgi:hypothetical protein